MAVCNFELLLLVQNSTYVVLILDGLSYEVSTLITKFGAIELPIFILDIPTLSTTYQSPCCCVVITSNIQYILFKAKAIELSKNSNSYFPRFHYFSWSTASFRILFLFLPDYSPDKEGGQNTNFLILAF